VAVLLPRAQERRRPLGVNDKIPYSVATITESDFYVANTAPYAVVGNIPHDWPKGDERGRMGIRLGIESHQDYPEHSRWITALAHEMGQLDQPQAIIYICTDNQCTGHVFGFWHEHQQHDRDSYVRFNCEAIVGYARVKQMV
jgi:hypothetical protein